MFQHTCPALTLQADTPAKDKVKLNKLTASLSSSKLIYLICTHKRFNTHAMR